MQKHVDWSMEWRVRPTLGLEKCNNTEKQMRNYCCPHVISTSLNNFLPPSLETLLHKCSADLYSLNDDTFIYDTHSKWNRIFTVTQKRGRCHESCKAIARQPVLSCILHAQSRKGQHHQMFDVAFYCRSWRFLPTFSCFSVNKHFKDKINYQRYLLSKHTTSSVH